MLQADRTFTTLHTNFLNYSTFTAMPAQKIQLHFVVTPSGEVEMYGTQFLAQTNTKPARLKYWKTNTALEVREPAKIVSWSFSSLSGQSAELAHYLGPGFKVLEQWEALKTIEQHQSDTQRTYVVTEHNNPGTGIMSEILYAGTNIATAQRIYEAKKRSAYAITLETFAGALKLL